MRTQLLFVAAFQIGSICVAGDSIDSIEHKDLKVACDQFWSNPPQVKRFRASGTCTLVMPKDDRRVVAEFKSAGREDLLRLQLRYLENRNMGVSDDRREFLADGKHISIASFSNNRRPNGCELEVAMDDMSGNHVFTMVTVDDLRKIIRNPLLPSVKSIEAGKFIERTILDGQISWRFMLQDKLQLVLYAKDGEPLKLVRADLLGKEQKLRFRNEIDWESIDGLMKLQSSRRTWFNEKGEAVEVAEVSFSHLELNAELDESELSFENYANCSTRRIIDRRPGATPPVLYFEGNSREDLKSRQSLAEVADELKLIQVAPQN